MAIQETSDQNFEKDVLHAQTPVLVDFFADWCGPCKMLTPILMEVGDEMAGKIQIVKINIDNNPNTPSQYGVRSIPTLILFNNGQAVSTKVGLVPKSKIIEWLQGNLV